MHLRCTITLCALLLYNMLYRFRFIIMFDDTEGYFVIGGGKYIPGVKGYFGPVIYHRNRIVSDIMVLLVILYLLNTCSYIQLNCSLCSSLIISFFFGLSFMFQMLYRI